MDEVTPSDSADLLDGATTSGIQRRYGTAWLEALPDLVRQACRARGLTVIRPLPGGRTACVLHVRSRAADLVLKLTPDAVRSEREHRAMVRYAEAGIAPNVVDYWSSDGAPTMLMEVVHGPGSLRDSPGIPVDLGALRDLLQALRECGTVPLDLPIDPVADHLRAALARGKGGGLHGTPPPSSEQVKASHRLLDDLVGNPGASMNLGWLHGTLHPANILRTHSHDLKVIDPRPFSGPAEYDVAEVSLKWGSERHARPHNIEDGLGVLQDLRRAGLHADEQLSADMMQVIATSGV